MEQQLRKTWPSTGSSEDRIIGEKELGQHLVVDGTPLSKWTALYIWPVASRISSMEEGEMYEVGQ